MKLYEIDESIENLIDPETGEIADFDAFEELQLTKEQKIEGIIIGIKNLTAEAKAIGEEVATLTARKKACENKADRLRSFIMGYLAGEKFKTSKVSVSYRNSESVGISDEDAFIAWAKENAPELLKFSDPTPSKTAIKEALERGSDVQYCTVDHNTSLIIK